MFHKSLTEVANFNQWNVSANGDLLFLPFEVLDTSWWWLSLFMGCKSLTIDMAEECPPKG
ncbi:MAG: hypothetical protein ACTS5A_02140 [Candidatus Hodgkinia cicadicola]